MNGVDEFGDFNIKSPSSPGKLSSIHQHKYNVSGWEQGDNTHTSSQLKDLSPIGLKMIQENVSYRESGLSHK